jgi:hypothetical protein
MKRCIGLSFALLAMGACGGHGEENEAATVIDRQALSAKLATVQGTKETHFADLPAFAAKRSELWQKYKADKESVKELVRTDETLRPVGRFDLFVLRELGRVFIGDKVAIDHDLLAQRPKEPEVDPTGKADPNGDIQRTSQPLVTYGLPPSFVQQNQGNYKTQGESYRADYGVYGEEGGQTQFKKYRRNFLIWGWWDTDASNLSARCVVFKNRSNYSEAWFVEQDSDTNDDVVTALVSVSIATPGDIMFANTGMYCFHAVDHAGLWWRLESALHLNETLDWKNFTQSYHVPWVNGQTCTGTPGGWDGCRGSGCWVCKERVEGYTKYFKNHPRCILNETCDGYWGTCNADCPAPTGADL